MAYTCSKGLIWLAVLLSPLHAMLGSRILCSLGTECGWVSCHRDDLACISKCSGHSDEGFGGKADVTRHSETAHPASCPDSPEKCPPGCWCRNPANPHTEPCHRRHLTTSAASTSSEVWSAVPCRDPQRVGVSNASSAPASSPMETCALLCRYLT